MESEKLKTAIEAVDRASATLYSNGHSEQLRIPKPLRPLLNWREREDLIVFIENPDTIRVVSLKRYTADVIEADRRTRHANGSAGS